MIYYDKYIPFSSLLGMTIGSIDNSGDEIIFEMEGGRIFKMYHDQDCCEHVSVEEIVGDLMDLIGHPLLQAEEISSSDPAPEIQAQRDQEKADKEAKGERYYDSDDSETWTFYKMATIKGSVTIRWYGSSNGYYSESVSFVEL
jgi:hypothetical protein